jgi:hypothetical protein
MPAHASAATGTTWHEIANDLYARGATIHRELASPDDRRWAEKVAGFAHRAEGIAIQSTIDRVDWIGADRWQVIDWKTGRFDPDHIVDAQLDLAHAALRASFRSRLGRDHTVRAMAINLLPGREPRVRELLREDAVATVAYYADLARQMRTNEDWRPTPGPYCGFCRWRPQCPAGDPDAEEALDWLTGDDDEDEAPADAG